MKRFVLKITGCLKGYEEALANAKKLQDKNASINEELLTMHKAFDILKTKVAEYENEKTSMELQIANAEAKMAELENNVRIFSQKLSASKDLCTELKKKLKALEGESKKEEPKKDEPKKAVTKKRTRKKTDGKENKNGSQQV